MNHTKTPYQTFLDAAWPVGLPKNQLLVYGTLIKYILRFNRQLEGAALSMVQISKETGLDKGNISRAIHGLEEKNMIFFDIYKRGDKNTYKFRGKDVPRHQKTIFYHRAIENWNLE